MKKLTIVLTLAATFGALTFSSCASKKKAYVPAPTPEVVMSK